MSVDTKRLIDGDKAKAVLMNIACHLIEAGDNARAGAIGAAAKIIDRQPTVDAVEVIRCRNCRWARQANGGEPEETRGLIVCQCSKHAYVPAVPGVRKIVDSDDYCSCGERKEETT